MMESMIERVARAICEKEYGCKFGWEEQIPTARSAIKAMRDHTKSMDSAGYDAYPENIIKTGVDHLDIYRAMIDSALAEP